MLDGVGGAFTDRLSQQPSLRLGFGRISADGNGHAHRVRGGKRIFKSVVLRVIRLLALAHQQQVRIALHLEQLLPVSDIGAVEIIFPAQQQMSHLIVDRYARTQDLLRHREPRRHRAVGLHPRLHLRQLLILLPQFGGDLILLGDIAGDHLDIQRAVNGDPASLAQDRSAGRQGNDRRLILPLARLFYSLPKGCGVVERLACQLAAQRVRQQIFQHDRAVLL